MDTPNEVNHLSANNTRLRIVDLEEHGATFSMWGVGGLSSFTMSPVVFRDLAEWFAGRVGLGVAEADAEKQTAYLLSVKADAARLRMALRQIGQHRETIPTGSVEAERDAYKALVGKLQWLAAEALRP